MSYRHNKNKPKKSQAARLFEKFGGVATLVRALQIVGYKRNKSSVYRWDYPVEKNGRGGIVPARAWPDIQKAARIEGLFLTAQDMDPRPMVKIEGEWRADELL